MRSSVSTLSPSVLACYDWVREIPLFLKKIMKIVKFIENTSFDPKFMTILWSTPHTLIYHPVKLWWMKIVSFAGKIPKHKMDLLCIKYLEPCEKYTKISFRLPVMYLHYQNYINSRKSFL
jgi:hypothetical protein